MQVSQLAAIVTAMSILNAFLTWKAQPATLLHQKLDSSVATYGTKPHHRPLFLMLAS